MYMKRYFYILISLTLVLATVYSCNEKADDAKDFDVQFNVPESVTLEENYTDMTFKVLFKKSPAKSDVLVLTDPAGTTHDCAITVVSDDSFTVSLYKGIYSGNYAVSIRRGDAVKKIGTMAISIKTAGLEPENGTTIYGIIACEGKGLKDVVVSDGVEVVLTNSDGVYQIKSEKRYGYVFISIPSGYEVPSKGVLPQFYAYLSDKASQPERKDFSLVKAGVQTKYKMFFFGDMHLANRTGDLSQFRVFTRDLTKYMNAHSGEKMYAMTLGDMTWDIYWYVNDFSFKEYLEEINQDIKGLQIFHTMGNHDNDYKAFSPDADFKAASEYVRNVAPTYYSFNIGKVHYVVLDDIDCSNYDGTKSRKYSRNLTTGLLEWLASDLRYVDKSTPLILTTHAQIFSPEAGDDYKVVTSNADRLFDILKGYKVHLVSGHTHVIYNVNPEESGKHGATDFSEHNSGAICASWWWSGNLTPGVYVGTDGSPAGYGIWDIDGTDIKWKFKATAWDEDYQFRTYDLNQVYFTYEKDVPKMPTDNVELTDKGFGKYVNAYPKNSNNEVLINIWNWNSKWTLTVTDEKGKDLNWTRTSAYDPLHIAALSAKRFNESGLKEAPNFTTGLWHHFFKVTAPDADTDLTITVTDEFGNVYTEKMERPKAFKVEDFKK